MQPPRSLHCAYHSLTPPTPACLHAVFLDTLRADFDRNHQGVYGCDKRAPAFAAAASLQVGADARGAEWLQVVTDN